MKMEIRNIIDLELIP